MAGDEMVPVTRAELAAALQEEDFAVDRISEGPGGITYARMRYPQEVADELLEPIAAAFKAKFSGPSVIMPPHDEPDAEIAAIDLVCHTLAHLGDADAVRRIIRYLRARFSAEA